ncbi:hypothetical protein BT93_L3714 [Corymbia citriodora subsp. variegata]|uniref:Uncharacterized protein n=1 Tax=Corymbia citriodora subsp. variegata TaxID=360336 RepID=A0A8T0CHU7_CORYI|nr:hypothetical protein BT93_L3714 [Corymbia citriodora subsp. variegata]
MRSSFKASKPPSSAGNLLSSVQDFKFRQINFLRPPTEGCKWTNREHRSRISISKFGQLENVGLIGKSVQPPDN